MRMRSGQGKPLATSSTHSTRSARCHQSSYSTIKLSAGLDREDTRQTLMPAAVSLASASVAPGNGSTPNRSTAAMERPLEGEMGGLSPDFVLREQDPHDVGGRPAARPVELHHRPDVRRGAGDDPLSGDSLRERPLEDAVIDGGRPNHVPADERYRRCIAHLRAS